ncbi:lasso peptide biosynthesis B2 protein [Photorhabdus australis]|uniref:lasso peptide biosynthesis B2 protein n=1 Tax=Photorhabdus australis TaxID=286156 RepID=UPI00055BEA92|nr:lasso peptide biosynthesis B2 protein [Photorhabdus australis]
MKSNNAYIFLIHSLVRAILLEKPIKDAYLSIFKSIYPCTVRRNFFDAKKHIDHSYFQEICDFIYQADSSEITSASCYSASIVVQLLASLHGIPSDMVIGIKKQDEKIVGHAWIELCSDKFKTKIVNPGHVDLSGYSLLQRMSPDTAISEWATSI